MKRYKFITIMLFFIFLFSISCVSAMIKDYSLIGKVIYLDAGHGGIDSGTVSGHILEKDINLVMVKKLEKELVSRGAYVYLTRSDDNDLSTSKNNRKRSDLRNRAYLINKSDCDIFISIHLNYFYDSKWKGLQIFYNDQNGHNKLIAEEMTNYLKTELKNVRDFKYSSDYYLYRNIDKPGVLIELGFLSNPDDKYALTKDEYQNKYVISIVNSIESIFYKGIL